MSRKKHLINVHTGTGTTAPSGADLYLGEIAVQHTSGSPALWVKVGASEESDSYEKFIGETEIREIVNNSNILGSGYTYTGIPYVNSATAIADAYSANTEEYDLTITYNPTANTNSFVCYNNLKHANVYTSNYKFPGIQDLKYLKVTIGYAMDPNGDPYRYSNINVIDFSITRT